MLSILILTALITLLTLILYKNAYKRHYNFPPGPPRLPVYGSYWVILAHEFSNLATAFLKLGKKYKTDIVGFYMGPFPSIVINHPVLIKEMFYKEEFDGRMDTILARLRSYWKKLGIFFTDGYFWHKQRRFSLRYMRDFGFGRRDQTLEEVVANEITEMISMRVNGVKYPAEKDIVRDDLVFLPLFFSVPFMNGMLQVFSRSTLPRSQYKTLWEVSRGAFRFQRNSDDLGRALVVTPWLKDVMPGWSGYKELYDGNQTILDFFTKIIGDVMKTQDDSHDRHFLDMYIKKMKEEAITEDKSTYSVEQLVLICTDYIFPASSAVQATLMFLIERMLLQPEIQDKVHEEIDRVVGRDRLPGLDDRKNMPYTEACLREIMRFETLVPLGVLHRAMKDTSFAGYDIPEGSIVAANFVALHMDKGVWGDPENFRPERFIENGTLVLSKDKSLPFGAGKRLCAGETYARQTLFQVFSGFMQAFDVSTADGIPLKKPFKRLQGIITTMPDFWLRINPRKMTS